MGFRMGIVGLPNVGKSTLFNALTKTAAAQAANFPFCTIEPNVGDVAVPDPRLDTLAEIAGSKQIIPTRMTFVDIAGLVKGASKGEGLGNQFLANIRETDAIAHVLRCFEDDDVTHVDGRVDPVADAETIETELIIADMESLEKRLQNIVRKVRGGDKEAVQQERLMKDAMAMLEQGKPARLVEVDAEDLKLIGHDKASCFPAIHNHVIDFKMALGDVINEMLTEILQFGRRWEFNNIGFRTRFYFVSKLATGIQRSLLFWSQAACTVMKPAVYMAL